MLRDMLMDHNLTVKKKPVQAAEHKRAGWIYPSHDALDMEWWQEVFRQAIPKYAEGILEETEHAADLQVAF